MIIDLEIEVSQKDIDFDVGTSSDEIDIDFGFSAVYTGKYEIDSAVSEQTLETANKNMLRDIIINPVPVSRVSAPDNKGIVVTIG